MAFAQYWSCSRRGSRRKLQRRLKLDGQRYEQQATVCIRRNRHTPFMGSVENSAQVITERNPSL